MKTLTEVIDMGTHWKMIYKHKPADIQRAMDLVERALRGKLGFCYQSVKTIYDRQALEHMEQLRHLNTERTQCESNRQARNCTARMKEIRADMQRYKSFDVKLQNKLRSNAKRLRNALNLLAEESIVHSFTLLCARDKLSISWVADNPDKPLNITVIENPFEHCKPDIMVKSAKQMEWEYQNDKLFCGHITEKQVVEKQRDIKRKLSSDQVKRIRKGDAVDQKVIANVGINADKWHEDVKYARKNYLENSTGSNVIIRKRKRS
jgi:hypothetical protein